MSENEQAQLTSISKAQSYEEIGEFWDTHSLDDYWEQTHEVEFEVRAKPRKRFTVDSDIYTRIEDQARRRGLLPEALINIWLTERLAAAA